MSDDTRTIHQFLGPDYAAMTPDELAAYIEADEKRGRPAMRSHDETADAFEQIETRRWYGARRAKPPQFGCDTGTADRAAPSCLPRWR
jgi:hypothetical protein